MLEHGQLEAYLGLTLAAVVDGRCIAVAPDDEPVQRTRGRRWRIRGRADSRTIHAGRQDVGKAAVYIASSLVNRSVDCRRRQDHSGYLRTGICGDARAAARHWALTPMRRKSPQRSGLVVDAPLLVRIVALSASRLSQAGPCGVVRRVKVISIGK
jgi:hypothetical protein